MRDRIGRTLRVMLDDFDKLSAADESGFLARLWALPGSYDGPDGRRTEPYGLTGFGETAPLSRALQSWVDAPLVVSGTQFMLASGFDYGELGTLKLNAEMTQAEVVVLGYAAYKPDLHVEQGVLSPYTYASYLAHATGHGDALGEAEKVMLSLRDKLGPRVHTNENPAKALAWTLWNRVPLIVAARADSGLPGLLQYVFARVGKLLALTAGEHPLGMLAGAFEGRHMLGDDVVALIAGPQDEETRLASEILDTRVAQVERLSLPFGGVGGGTDDGIGEAVADPGARALVLWYISLHVAAYVAMLHGLSPEDSSVYSEVSRAVGAV